MGKKLFHKIPFFIFYDLFFLIMLLVTHKIVHLQYMLSVLFWIGFVFTQLELAIRILFYGGYFKNTKKNFWIFFVSLSCSLNLFVFFYFTIQKTIYFWDSSLYWTSSINFTNEYFSGFVSSIKNLYFSINNSDYNLLPTLIISLPMKVFGYSYRVYTLSILNLYLIPTILLTVLFTRKILQNTNMFTKTTSALSLVVPFLFTPFMIPLMNGFLDSAGMPYVILLFMIIYSDSIIQFNMLRNISFYLFLLLLLFTRRWYAFFAIGFLVSFIISRAISILIKKKKNKWKYFFGFLINMSIVGLLCLLTIIFIFKGFFLRSLFNNYAIAYSAYQQGNVLMNLSLAEQYFGLIILAMALLGTIVFIFKKKELQLILIIFFQLLISFILFVRIQSFSDQHYYIVAIQICILSTLGLCWLANIGKKVTTIAALLVSIFFIYNFAQTFIPFFYNFKEGTVLSNVSVYPQQRQDIGSIKSIISDLNGLTRNNGEKAYLLSSSFTLNSSIIMNSELPNNENALPALFQTQDVDLRDGFPNSLFLADYVLVASPIQYHLRPEDQEVVGMLANLFLNKHMDNFKQVKTYYLENGVKVLLYKKIKEYDYRKISLITNYFKNKYGDNPLLQVNSLLPYLQEQTLQKKRSNVQVNNNDVIITNFKKKITLKFRLRRKFKKLSFNIVTDSGNGHLTITYNSVKRKVFLVNNKQKMIKINVKGRDKIYLTFDKSKPINSQMQISNIYLK